MVPHISLHTTVTNAQFYSLQILLCAEFERISNLWIEAITMLKFKLKPLKIHVSKSYFYLNSVMTFMHILSLLQVNNISAYFHYYFGFPQQKGNYDTVTKKLRKWIFFPKSRARNSNLLFIAQGKPIKVNKCYILYNFLEQMQHNFKKYMTSLTSFWQNVVVFHSWHKIMKNVVIYGSIIPAISVIFSFF